MLFALHLRNRLTVHNLHLRTDLMSLFTLFLFNFHSLVGTFSQHDGFHHSDCDLYLSLSGQVWHRWPKMVQGCLSVLRTRQSYSAISGHFSAGSPPGIHWLVWEAFSVLGWAAATGTKTTAGSVLPWDPLPNFHLQLPEGSGLLQILSDSCPSQTGPCGPLQMALGARDHTVQQSWLII